MVASDYNWLVTRVIPYKKLYVRCMIACMKDEGCLTSDKKCDVS